MAINDFPMRTVRALAATDPLHFGRAPLRDRWPGEATGLTIFDDLRLFGTTFAAGFLFVSILIA
jgi:hypothetical protein